MIGNCFVTKKSKDSQEDTKLEIGKVPSEVVICFGSALSMFLAPAKTHHNPPAGDVATLGS